MAYVDCDWSGAKWGPLVQPRAWARLLREAAPNARGVSCWWGGRNWTSHILDRYVYYKTLWNPQIHVEALIDDILTAYFGPAAEPMKDFFSTLEENLGRAVNYHREGSARARLNALSMKQNMKVHLTEKEYWTKIYTPERFAKLEKLFAEAARLARGSLHADRVALFRKHVLDEFRARRRRYFLSAGK